MALDAPHIGFVVRETPDKIVVFGEKNERYDIPISEIQTVSKNVLIGLNFYYILFISFLLVYSINSRKVAANIFSTAVLSLVINESY